jgi:uncharacterized protein with PQ loop repeat
MAVTIVMIIGAAFIGFFSLPNLISVLKTKNTLGINLPMYVLFVTSCTCFMIYGLGIMIDTTLGNMSRFGGGLPTLISNSFCVTIGLITLTIKLYNIHRAKQHNMTELQYWDKVIKGDK